MTLALLTFAALSLAAPAPAVASPHLDTLRGVSRSVVRLSGSTTYGTYLDILRETVPDDVAVEVSEEARNAQHENIASGIVFDNDGHVVTTASFATSGGRIRAQLADGTSDDATVVGLDPASDLAVLKLASKRPPAGNFLANLDAVKAGDTVCIVAAGPGAKCAITAGNLKRVNLNPGAGRLHDYLHVDSEPDPGAAGAAVTSSTGGILGMVSLRMIGRGTLALPATTIISLTRAIIGHEATVRATLGVTVFTPALPRAASHGVHIGGVVSDSPAARAGLQPGDVVLEFDGVAIDDVTTLKRLVWAAKPEQIVDLTFRRGDVVQVVRTLLAAEPVRPNSGRIVVRIATTYLGLDTVAVTITSPEGETRGLRAESVDRGSPAEQAGVRVGDVIVQFDRQPVLSSSEFHRLLNSHHEGETTALTVLRDGQRLGIRVVLGSNIEMARLPQEHFLAEPNAPLDQARTPTAGAEDMIRSVRQGLDKYRSDELDKP